MTNIYAPQGEDGSQLGKQWSMAIVLELISTKIAQSITKGVVVFLGKIFD